LIKDLLLIDTRKGIIHERDAAIYCLIEHLHVRTKTALWHGLIPDENRIRWMNIHEGNDSAVHL
jgi:hypothetical protein